MVLTSKAKALIRPGAKHQSLARAFRLLSPSRLRDARNRRIFRKRHFTVVAVNGHRAYRLNQVPDHIREYYDYVFEGVTTALRSSAPDPRKAVHLSFAKHIGELPLNGIKILLQHEQTVVVGSPDFRVERESEFHWSGAQAKWVRLHGPRSAYSDADWIIEYSAANISNVLESELRNYYAGKALYVAPVLGELVSDLTPKSSVTLHTMFGSPHLGRRADFLARARESGLSIENLSGHAKVSNALKDTAILANLRQKNYFQTFEELRVLPALLSGVLVVTEESPYLSSVPYHALLIKSQASLVAQTLAATVFDYESLHRQCFGGSGFERIVESLVHANRMHFETVIHPSRSRHAG